MTARHDTGDATEFNELVALLQSRRSPRSRWLRDIWVGAALLALVGLALGTVWVLDQRTKTTQFTLDDALTRLHRTELADPAPGTTTPRDPAIDGSSIGSDAQEPSDDPTPAPVRRSTGAAGTADPGTGMTLPVAGVYTYATEGGEKISMLGAKHDYPAETHAIVTHTGGCEWTIEHRVIEEHVDHFERCSTNGMFQLLDVSREVEFFSQRDGVDYLCESPFEWIAAADAPGAAHHVACASDAGDQLVMDLTVTARGTRNVGGTVVPTLAFTANWKMTGKATGWARTETVLDATTGLMVHEHRVVDTDAHAVFGDVHYFEDVTFDLLSTTPMR
jgi:hypothetical protein